MLSSSLGLIRLAASRASTSASSSCPLLSVGATSSSPLSLLLTAHPVRCRHSRTDQREEYFILRDPPIGPYKKLPPYKKLNGRVGEVGEYKKIVHWPEDGKYTIDPLKITKLSGRDPETGRKIISGHGGGHKRRYRWIDWLRLPPDWDPEGPDYEERVIEVRYDPLRKAQIALVGHGDRLRWIIATVGMKEGDLIRTNGRIPTTPVKPVEGDSYPLGALPVGTTVCLTEFLPGDYKKVMFHRANEYAKIIRKEGDRVIIKNFYDRDYSLDQRCQTVVGTVSIHPLWAANIGTPNRLRWQGFAPRSGFFQKKTGRFGRKIRKPPPVEVVMPEEPKKYTELLLTHTDHGRRGRKPGKHRKVFLSGW